MKNISEDIKKEMKKLVKELKRHADLYYRLDSPEILDWEYDQLYRKLEKLEEESGCILPDSPTQQVGAPPLEDFEEIKHTEPMLSLMNIVSYDKVREFDQRNKKNLKIIEDITYTVEPKYDGVAMELVYKNGILFSAATRGDGYIGEDVTQNIKTIKSIPLKIEGEDIPETIDIRGEVYMDIDEFEAINRDRELQGKTVFANPRNAAAGSIKQLEASITSKRNLKMACYGIGSSVGEEFESQSEVIDWLKNRSFPIPSSITIARGAGAVIKAIKDIESKRDHYPFETDGAVIKVNQISIQINLGATSHAPRWARAYKFPAERGITQILEIKQSVGKSGAITPVANLQPVRISGVTVSSSSLHNWDEVVRKDIRIGDTVEVERAGDVIPHIVKVKLDNRTGKEGLYFPNDKCPQCGSSVIREEGEVAFRCIGLNCNAQVKEKIRNYASKSAMDIEGLGEKNIELLYEYGLVKHFADIYKLDEFNLLRLPGFAEKSAHNIISAVNKSKETTLTRFLLSLGIPFIGKFSARLISQNFKDVKDLIDADMEDLKKIDQIGDKVAKSLSTFLNDVQNIQVLEKMVSETLDISNPDYKKRTLSAQVEESVAMPFSNLTFVITGSLPKSRSEVEKYIEQLGGRVSKSISKRTNYLILGENPGSKKAKADGLGVEVISYDELIKMGKAS